MIAYKLLVHLSILNDYGCRWYTDTELGRTASSLRQLCVFGIII